MTRNSRYTWSRLLAATLVTVICAGLGIDIGAQQEDGLFTAAVRDQAVQRVAARAEVRSRPVDINLSRLPATTSADTPARIVLNPFDDARFVMAVDSIEAQGANVVSYLGHVEEFSNAVGGNDQNQVSLVVLDGVMAGSIVTPTASYQIDFDGTSQVIRQVDPGAYPEDIVLSGDNAPVAADAPPAEMMNDDGSRIDLMVLYTTGARLEAGSTAAIQARITLGVTETNQAYANSGIGTRLRLVHMRETSYAETNGSNDLSNLTNGAGVLNIVGGLRDSYGADVVQLITTNAGCGVAWLGGPAASMAGQANRGFSVTEYSCISPNYTFGHEIGHNLGSNHTRQDGGGTGAYPYSWGWRSCNSAPFFRTVMAYACPTGATGTARSLNFSNPAVNISNSGATAPSGTVNDNNALSIHNVRGIVANWRQERPLVQITALWPPADEALPDEGAAADTIAEDRRAGQTTTLWAQVRNNGPYALPANAAVWFYTDGPGSGSGEGWVGNDSVAGLAPGATVWFSFNWNIPTDAQPGNWVYWARVWDAAAGEYLSDWEGPQAFSVLSVEASVTSVWPVADTRAGQPVNLWARVRNTGGAPLPPNTSVYFYVSGPGLNGYVGSTSVAGLAAGAESWYLDQWYIPVDRDLGGHTYYAIVWNQSVTGAWRAISGWSASESFNVAAALPFSGHITQTWPVYKAGTGAAAERGSAARLWALGLNSGSNAHDANVHVWYYVNGPSGAVGWIGSTPTTGQAPGSSAWRLFDWDIPAGAPLGGYSYTASFWRLTGSGWVSLGPASSAQAFDVIAASDGADRRPEISAAAAKGSAIRFGQYTGTTPPVIK